MKNLVIMEHDNFRNRTERRYQLMYIVRNEFNHAVTCDCLSLEEAKKLAADKGLEILGVGTFYQLAAKFCKC